MVQAKSSYQALEPHLAEVVARVRMVGRPMKIVLFGSWARQDARGDSDIDLLIVERSDLPRYQRSAKYRATLLDLMPERDIDIVVWTPEEIEEWANVPQAFISTILREGRTLHEDAC